MHGIRGTKQEPGEIKKGTAPKLQFQYSPCKIRIHCYWWLPPTLNLRLIQATNIKIRLPIRILRTALVDD
jgi:hypothetical protein